MYSAKFLLMVLFLQLAHQAYAQDGQNSISQDSNLKKLEQIEIVGEKDQLDENQAYESVDAKTVVNKKKIERAQARDVKDLLQKVPGVSVTGGSELQNQQVSIRGLSGYRVVQKVDGAQRAESTQSGLQSGIAVEPDILTQVSVQNGADSVTNSSGAMGGTVDYKTIDADDILMGSNRLKTRVKLTADSATEGQATSVQAATPLNSSTSLLLGTTLRDSKKIESGSPNDSAAAKEESVAVFKRNTYLGKLQSKFARSKADFKFEYSTSQNKNAAYSAGSDETNSDYNRNSLDLVGNYEQSIGQGSKVEAQAIYNTLDSKKLTHTAYRGMNSTLGTTEDSIKNAGVKVKGISALNLAKDASVDSSIGLELNDSRISEKDGSDVSYYGDSKGSDVSLFSENTLNLMNDKVGVSIGARATYYDRSSTKLSLNVPQKSGDTFSTAVGLSYSPTQWMKISAKAGLANRAPHVREMYYGSSVSWKCHRPAKDCTSSPNPDLNEEFGRTKEISLLLKMPRAPDTQRIKVSYFDEVIGDYIEWMPEMYKMVGQQRVAAGPAEATHRDYKYRNLSEVVRRGVELQGQFDIQSWQLEAGYSAIKMDCKDCPDMYSAQTLNEPLVSAPADKFLLGVGYDFKSARVRLGADAQFVSAQKRLSERYIKAGYATPAYDVYGVSAQWYPKVREFGDVNLGLNVSNLFDKMYMVHNSSSGAYELGRNYSLSVTTIF